VELKSVCLVEPTPAKSSSPSRHRIQHFDFSVLDDQFRAKCSNNDIKLWLHDDMKDER
jgi:hypothetical protein